jgi:hypothetical protein
LNSIGGGASDRAGANSYERSPFRTLNTNNNPLSNAGGIGNTSSSHLLNTPSSLSSTSSVGNNSFMSTSGNGANLNIGRVNLDNQTKSGNTNTTSSAFPYNPVSGNLPKQMSNSNLGGTTTATSFNNENLSSVANLP